MACEWRERERDQRNEITVINSETCSKYHFTFKGVLKIILSHVCDMLCLYLSRYCTFNRSVPLALHLRREHLSPESVREGITFTTHYLEVESSLV